MLGKLTSEEESRGPQLLWVTSRIPMPSLEGGIFSLDLSATFYGKGTRVELRDKSQAGHSERIHMHLEGHHCQCSS